MPEDVRKHLDFIQGVISRLAGNSFTLKGWAVTLVSGLIAFGAQGADKVGPNAILLAVVPAVAFWWLDAACLRREKLYRKLYDDARTQTTTDYSMDIAHLSNAIPTTWRLAATSSLLGFYAALVFVAVAFRIMKFLGVA